MHTIEQNGKDAIVVRQLMPGAHSIDVVDKESGEKYNIEMIHDNGYFESVIPQKTEYFEYYLEVDFGEGNVWTTYDQYTFPPTISEYDTYLFNNGNNYNIYEKLGSHLRTVNGVEGVSFVVWAPNAKSISVVGNFNNWDARRSMMRLLGESGVWEIFIPGLKEFDIYKYHVKFQDGRIVEKTDPYGNFTELRPDKASVIYDINGFEWHDDEWIKRRETEDVYNLPVNIYEVHIGSWMRVPEEGDRFLTYSELSDKLVKYVKEMNYTHVEFMPVMEYPFDGSWGYQVTGYYAPTSRYGTPKEFMKLVDTLHKNNIGVIMDWVPAHFPRDENGLARFDGTALYEHEDFRRGEHIEWGTYIFNYGRNEVRNFLIANAVFWIKEYHIDGLRVDAVASMLYLDYCRGEGQWLPNKYGGRENLEAVEFLKHMNSIINKKYKGVLMIAEESTSWEGVTRNADYDGLGFSLKWNMGWMNDFLSYIKKETVHRKYHHNLLTFSLMYAFSENFVLVLSHDEVVHMKGSMMYKVPGDMWQKTANLKTAYGYMYGHPGKKLMFMGNEIGQFSEWSEARSLDWHILDNEYHRNLQTYIKDLNKFYMEEPALWQRDFDGRAFEWIECDDSERSIVSFTRRGHKIEDQLSIVCNFTEIVYDDFIMGVPEEVDYVEAFNSDDMKYGGTGRLNRGVIKNRHCGCNRCPNSVKITLPPLGFVVLKPCF
ncbi:MAG: 1,4-alpha-glucan branching protein GlgB [Firmicutes bacterium]|nr:1,4-alpha-glucan branching protein GlgB [Bacillota bacterium]